ncbi:hypothetical protein TPHA_0J00590 [Tetrapisispora phaffii CBS 4417]|uniref:GB1/RHD3-type G domain-containing protein n=1 Tax=Tetrapisispora phaffii (strain ATCC 24235 / CBS 4417 / NBRC 1672 / NRRL Y-8282 / UCD 70-5) TaxID=1071381 RepID=G8BYE0_TETPH|nr:hypothetical protein TPHA_0J00590 [Tetrapisispora phaffii CBS 4417]CCE64882.1 hypothetical protein TPHA_0J00590 [Tetrapisispora phaffii CBS 4417]
MTSLKNDAIQLINEDKEFNEGTISYFNKCIDHRNVGMDYHVISVFGSQSSGKSTLLNILFNTKFDTMDAQVKRQQTTKGIWVSHTQQVSTTKEISETNSKDLFILDIEGSDGQERGEDQDFERKAALFAIAVSEVLIVNMWEQQIGLYQGNNMGLLKTVFEVNLSLFGKNKDDHKVLLLFVIRDHVGVTPISSLKETVSQELENLWNSLSKPVGSEDTKISDYFDLEFAGLSHKLLQQDKFEEDVRKLGDHFVQTEGHEDDCYFKKEYHHNLPLDGWTLYANNCWELIEHNKDLDLPTQQILVARFKTDDIATESLKLLESNYNDVVPADIKDKTYLISSLQELKSQCLDMYDGQASKYAKKVYLQRREDLVQQIDERFSKPIRSFLNFFTNELIDSMKQNVTENTKKEHSFIKRLDSEVENAQTTFTAVLLEFNKSDLLSDKLVEEMNKNFDEVIDETTAYLRSIAIEDLIKKSNKLISNKVKDQSIALLSHPETNVWDIILEKFNATFDDILKSYRSDGDDDEVEKYDFKLSLTKEHNDKIFKEIRVSAWNALYDAVHNYLKEDTIANIIRDRFENKFRFDEDDSPRLWKSEEEIDSAFRVAREHAMEIFNVLTLMSTSDKVEIIPDVELKDESTLDEDELAEYHSFKFAHILNDTSKEKAQKQIRRQINIAVLDAKRSMIQTTTHIPVWVYVLLLVLGWGKLMAIVRNPLSLTLGLLAIVSFYFVHKFDLWNPVMNVAQTVVGEAADTVKLKLREFVLDDDEKNPKKQSAAKHSE